MSGKRYYCGNCGKIISVLPNSFGLGSTYCSCGVPPDWRPIKDRDIRMPSPTPVASVPAGNPFYPKDNWR